MDALGRASRYNAGAMRVALFYFVLFTSVGLILPYLPPYYRSLGFSGKEIALAVSVQPLLSIVVPPLWGYLADRTARPDWLLQLATMGAALAFVPMLFSQSVWAVVAVLAVFSIFTTPLGSLIDSIAVVEARRIGTDYARLRLWGSLGFVAASWSFGQWLTRGGASGDVVAWILAAVVGYAVVARFLVPTPNAPHAVPPSLAEAGLLLRRPAMLLFLAANLVHWAALAPYHMLFALHLEGLGASAASVGGGFAAAVIAEVVVMWRFRDLARRIPLESILVLAYLSGVVRWFLTGTLQSGTAIALLQALHGFTYGAFFVGSILWLEREVPDRLRATGRALFTAVSLGFGGVLGNALAGSLYDIGGGGLAFRVAAALGLLPPLLLLASLRLAQRAAPRTQAASP